MSEESWSAARLADRRRSLRAECDRCSGLCCVAPAFSASTEFAVDKPAGQACRHLQPDFRCDIHAELGDRGFPGCTVFDCFGAGQQVAATTYGGQDWRRTPGIAQQMFTAFAIMRQLHELLWYLTEALTLQAARALRPDLGLALDETERLTRLEPDELVELDVAARRGAVNALLLRASELARAAAPGRPLEHRGADLVGRNFRGADLRGANFRGARLLGADLRDADLRLADVTGADLRGSDLRGADLSEALFVTRLQVAAARGDLATRLPGALSAPSHWARSTIAITPVTGKARRARRR